MSQLTPAGVVTAVEKAIGKGELAEAESLLGLAESRLGAQPAFAELRQRMAEVAAALSSPGAAEKALVEARHEAARANYPVALEILQQALRASPQSAELRELREQTMAAAMRHERAVERNQAVAAVATRIEELVAGGEIDTAANALQEAVLKFGRHNTLLELQEKLDEERKQAELDRTVAFVDQGRAFMDGENWQGALREAERALRLDPKHSDARNLLEQARTQLQVQTADQDHVRAIEQAAANIERLVKANELPAAGCALEKAIDQLGNHASFDAMNDLLNRAKGDQQSAQRLEWAQRRLTEADALVREASRLSLQGKYDMAIERLEQALELNPDHPEVEGMLSAAETARARAATERQRAQALQDAKQRIRSLLDDLRLDEAEAIIQTTRQRFPDDAQLGALANRLERLREAEAAAGVKTPAAGMPTAVLDAAAEAEALARQQAMATAYSWKQAALFPLRGDGFAALAVSIVAMLGLELLASVPALGIVGGVLRVLLPLAVLGAGLHVVRETFAGHNALPPATVLFAPGRYFPDLGLVTAALVVTSLPLIIFIVTRGGHGLLDGKLGFLLLALCVYVPTFAMVLGATAVGAFGPRYLPRLGGHWRALAASDADLLLTINLIFVAIVTTVILRLTFQPLIPWIGSPLASAIEAYALIGLPHLLGVVARRHRIELTRAYS